jgi:hypothetical protein
MSCSIAAILVRWARAAGGPCGRYPLVVPLTLVKLLLTPFFIGGMSLIARRWGPAVAGFLVALPLTSGPVVIFVALEHGSAFGQEVGLAVLSGGFGLCAYAIAYARASAVAGALASSLVATTAFVVAGLLVTALDPTSLPLVVVGVGLAMAAAIALVEAPPEVVRPGRPPRWDLPARVLVGTALIVGLTTLAPALGARLSGLVATYPVYVTTLTVFAHRQAGAGAALALLRGLVLGLYGWLGFFTIALATMPVIGILPAAACAVVGALAIQAVSLRLLGGSITAGVREAVVSETVP